MLINTIASPQLHFEVPLSPVIAPKKARPADTGSDEASARDRGHLFSVSAWTSGWNVDLDVLSTERLIKMVLTSTGLGVPPLLWLPLASFHATCGGRSRPGGGVAPRWSGWPWVCSGFGVVRPPLPTHPGALLRSASALWRPEAGWAAAERGESSGRSAATAGQVIIYFIFW